MSLSAGNNFNFLLDEHEHTLYFIPDQVTFASYIPTVFGKTVMLTDNSYFTASGNMNVVFEVLKVQPLGTGPGIISVMVTQATSAAAAEKPAI